jgi:hypothetical protein
VPDQIAFGTRVLEMKLVIGPDASMQSARPEANPADDLVEIRGITIREVSGECQKP